MMWWVNTKLPPLALSSWEKVDISLEEFPLNKFPSNAEAYFGQNWLKLANVGQN